jgi:hypothetical protein
MKFHRVKSKKRVGMYKEYYPDGPRITFHIKLWVLALILITVILGILVLLK